MKPSATTAGTQAVLTTHRARRERGAKIIDAHAGRTPHVRMTKTVSGLMRPSCRRETPRLAVTRPRPAVNIENLIANLLSVVLWRRHGEREDGRDLRRRHRGPDRGARARAARLRRPGLREAAARRDRRQGPDPVLRAPRDRTPAGRARVPLLAAVLLARPRHHGAHPARPGGEGPRAARPRGGAERPGPPGPRAGRRDRAAQPGAELSRSVSSAVSRCSVRPSGQQSIPSGLSRTRGRPLIVSSKPPCEAPAISTSVPPGTRSSVTKAFSR